jgi:hypothetical protein
MPIASREPDATARRPAARAHRRADLAIGVVLGLILGLAAISAFVFLGSEGSVDAPRVPVPAGRQAAGPLAPGAVRQTRSGRPPARLPMPRPPQ